VRLKCLRRSSGPPTVKLADIHRQICEVYGENAMSDGMVRKWVRQFNEGRENVHDEV
jgi:hypothetical protein